MSGQTTAQTDERQRAERKDNGVRKVKDGRYQARPTLGIDPLTGKQVRVTKTFGTKREADAWVREQKQKFDGGSWSARSGRTFAEVCDHWLTVREADPDIRANTIRADRESLAYARRAFGALSVQKLTPVALTDWSLSMTARSGKPLGQDTKRRAIGTLKQVMSHAVAMRWVSADPAAHLTLPKQRAVVVQQPKAEAERDGQTGKAEVDQAAAEPAGIWTPAQMDAFAAHVAGHRLAGCFALTLLGLRREEVGGLRWCDVDLTDSTLSIVQARVDVNGRNLIEPPKTGRSVRELPIPARELAVLKAMRKVHIEERLAVGNPLCETDLLMSRPDGTWLPVRDYSREFTAERKAAKLPPITLRNARHSSVSRMRARGVTTDVVASWHGHTERMTMAVYTRVTDDRLKAAAAAISG